MRSIIVLIICTAFSVYTNSNSLIDLRKETNFRENTKILQYNFIMSFGFTQFGDHSAYTNLLKEKDDPNPRRYFISINVTEYGKSVSFGVYTNCKENEDSFQSVISVNGQNIATTAMCLVTSTGSSFIAHAINTNAGERFAVNQLISSDVVVVRFHIMQIPFLSGDFEEAWADAGGPAL